jgi:hypothetical protein
MASWVAPVVAAELWGVSVAHILGEVSSGRLRSRVEGDMIFVDIDPSAADTSIHEPAPQKAYRRSLAWTMYTAASEPIVTAEERDALLDEPANALEPEIDFEAPLIEDGLAGDALTNDDVPNWDEVRSRVSRQRRAPVALQAA